MPAHVVAIRRAMPDDAAAIALVHVRTWQAAYRDLLPADFLVRLDLDRRTTWWAAELAPLPRGERPFVAEVDGDVVGFIQVGRSRDDDASRSTGEVAAIYVLPAWWGRRVGQRLMKHGVAALRAAGFTEATLWVLAGNTLARRFYERGGWSLDGARRAETIGGESVEEVRLRRSLRSDP